MFVDICHAREIGVFADRRKVLAPAVQRVFAGESGEFGINALPLWIWPMNRSHLVKVTGPSLTMS